MDENYNLFNEVSDDTRKKELYTKISRTILNMEIENARNFKSISEREMANKIVKLIEKEIR